MRYVVAILLALVLVGCKAKKVVATGSSGSTTTTTTLSTATEKKLGFAIPKNANKALYTEVADWLGTPYKYGGETKSGTDCSGFVQAVYTKVYNKTLPRSSKEQYGFVKKIDQDKLTEGDLIFFNTSGKGVSHVGIFLYGQRFAHASSSKGVIVSQLTEPYWKNAYLGCGRVE